MRIMTILGTRPEAIKLAPLILDLHGRTAISHSLCATGQHAALAAEALALFGLAPDHDLALMRPGQAAGALAASAATALAALFDRQRPDRVVVQGDTASAFAGALAAFHAGIPVAHVEAGLRTGSLAAPFPEEGYRRMIAALADLHFAPTENAAANLRREGIAEKAIFVTGNTVVDALRLISARLDDDSGPGGDLARRFAMLTPGRRLILVTGHRREALDEDLARVVAIIAGQAERGDIDIVWPVHPNPAVGAALTPLAGQANVHLLPPLDYTAFVWLLRRAHVVVTDSGGVQEEAPAFGVPVLVTRDDSERREAVAAGTARLVGRNGRDLAAALARLLDDPAHHAAMRATANPFGDGHAARRIVDALLAGARPAATSF